MDIEKTDIHGRLVRVETKLDYIGTQVGDFGDKLDVLTAFHEQERGRSQLVRALIPLGSAMIGAISIVVARLLHWIR